VTLPKNGVNKADDQLASMGDPGCLAQLRCRRSDFGCCGVVVELLKTEAQTSEMVAVCKKEKKRGRWAAKS
jgi:hypothetical protein